VLGTQDEVIFIEFSTEKLAGLRLDYPTIVATLQAQNVVRPAGVMQTGNERVFLRVTGAFDTERDIENVNIVAGDRIVRLGDTLDRETRTLKVRIAVAARDRLKPEMYATVRLVRGEERVLTVPASAIQDIDGKQTVFVESQAGRFEPRRVVAEIRTNEALVRVGLREGDRVATQGSYFLKGHLVQAREGQSSESK